MESRDKHTMDKLCTLSEAVSRLVEDGDCIYCAGFTHLIPFAAGHEIIRQGRRDLVLARATPDLIYDQMVAAGCARKIIFSYMGNPGVGSLRLVRASHRSREAGMGGIFAFWDDYPFTGRGSRFALLAHEFKRGGRSGKRQCQPTGGCPTLTGEARWWLSRRFSRMSPSCTSSARMRPGMRISGGLSASKKKWLLLRAR